MKVALVTGGARRIGAAITRALHAAGMCVAIHYHRSGQDAERLASELEALRPRSTLLLQADLLSEDAPAHLVDKTCRTFGRLDVLVNNASSFHATPVGEIDASAWHDLVGTNLKTPLFLSQAAAAHLKASRGAIVNIVDIHAERPLKDYIVYSVAKAGLVALTRSLALELGPDIRVNGVAPGAILWPEDMQHFAAAEQEDILRRSALKRLGDPADVAGAVRYLALEAPYVTGQILAVDGGRSVHI